VVGHPLLSAGPLLTAADARREAEEMLAQFSVVYPNEQIVRTALRGAAAYQLPWFDAHLWAYADYYGLSELISEDFEHGRPVRVRARRQSVPAGVSLTALPQQ